MRGVRRVRQHTRRRGRDNDRDGHAECRLRRGSLRLPQPRRPGLEFRRGATLRAGVAGRGGDLAAHGPLVADTGVHTGRRPKDKFIVRDAKTDPIVWWDNNNAMRREHFDTLLADFLAHAEGKALFAQDLYGGADPAYRVSARVFTEYAWHSLFIRNLLIRPRDGRTRGLRPRSDDRRPALVPRRSEAPRLPHARRSSPSTSPARSS